MKKKMLLPIIILMLAVQILSSCSSSGAANSNNDSETTVQGGIQSDSSNLSDSSESAAEVTTLSALESAEPLPEMNFNGKVFTGLIRSEYTYEFAVDEQNGEVVNDSVYSRNSEIEEKYNTKLEFIDIAGDWNNRSKFMNAISSSNRANDGIYDYVVGDFAYTCVSAVNGEFLNLLNMPYLELESSWWMNKGIKALTLNECCYMITGDIVLSLYEDLFAMFFNKKMADNYNVENIYTLVKDNNWTHDKFAEITKGITGDINGDGVFDQADQYGVAAAGNMLRQYVIAYNTPIISSKDDGTPYISWYTEHTVSVVEKLVDYYCSSGSGKLINSETEILSMFQNDQVFILPHYLGKASSLRSMDSDFGIIPYPKFDEKEENYQTFSPCSMAMLMKCCKSPEDSSFILEALCRKSAELVTPAFYEIALKSKYSRDPDSEIMIDIIRSSMTFDFGRSHSPVINLGNTYQIFVEGNDTDFASYYASREQELTEKLQDIIEAYKK